MWNTNKNIYQWLLILLLFSFSAEAKPECLPSLHTITKHPKKYLDKTVTLTGEFKGWKYLCKKSGSNTRSDWILVSGNDCLFVSGKRPKGLSPMNPKNEIVTVTGKIKKNSQNRIYLDASKI